MRITINIPDNHFQHQSQELIQKQIKTYTALMMYRNGQISAGGACEIAGVNRFEFLELCKAYQISVINYSAEDVLAEVQSFKQKKT